MTDTQIGAPALEARGFHSLGGSALRKRCGAELVIDMLPDIFPSHPWQIELRCHGARICGRVGTLDELDTLLRVFRL